MFEFAASRAGLILLQRWYQLVLPSLLLFSKVIHFFDHENGMEEGPSFHHAIFTSDGKTSWSYLCISLADLAKSSNFISLSPWSSNISFDWCSQETFSLTDLAVTSNLQYIGVFWFIEFQICLVFSGHCSFFNDAKVMVKKNGHHSTNNNI